MGDALRPIYIDAVSLAAAERHDALLNVLSPKVAQITFPPPQLMETMLAESDAIFTFLLLARAFRSIVLPLKALALNALSVAAAWGILVLVFQQGHGSQLLFGVPATGSITEFIPAMVFAYLFGLSMDYEVFVLSRICEEYDRTGNTNAAIVNGLGRTGRLVTSAALVLFLAFAALASAPNTNVKIFATGLGAGILLDAVIVRALLLPALVSLFGRANWWWPRPLARLSRHSDQPQPILRKD